MMQETTTIGVILVSNSTPDGADTENPPAGILLKPLVLSLSGKSEQQQVLVFPQDNLTR